MIRATRPGTTLKLLHNPELYTPAQLFLLSTIVRRLNRGVFFYLETP